MDEPLEDEGALPESALLQNANPTATATRRATMTTMMAIATAGTFFLGCSGGMPGMGGMGAGAGMGAVAPGPDAGCGIGAG